MASANYARRLIRRVTEGPQSRQREMSASLIGHHCQALCFRRLLSSLRVSRFSTWSALHVAATGIGQTEVESLALGRVLRVRFGS